MPSDFLPTGDTPRSALRDLLLLTLLCALINTLGLTDAGVTSWQESVRLVTAMDMHARGDWIVPTIHGTPYLAKPPLVYWCTLALAELSNHPVALWHLRLVVALFGWLGVVATYLAARSILAGPNSWSPARAAHAAWWAALFLATGLLHVRMSRTGAIDIAATPFVVLAIWGGFHSWRAAAANSWKLPLLPTLAALTGAAGAALVKGPPTVLAIFCPLLGGVLGYLASRHTPAPRLLRTLLSLLAIALVAILALPRIDEPRDILGMLLAIASLLCLLTASLGLVRLSPLTLLRTLWRCQIPAILVGALAPVLIWSRLVASRIGHVHVQSSAAEEMQNNIDLFRPSAAAQLFEAASYGCGLGSLFAFVAASHLFSRRIALTPGIALAAAWVGVTLVAFAAFSTGSGRYITPMWPGVAILGAIAYTTLRDHHNRRWLAHLTAAAVLALALGQAWWYASARNNYAAHHGPRDFITELIAREDIDPARIASWGFWNGGLTAYAHTPVIAIDRPGFPTHYPPGPISLEDFAARVRSDNAHWVILVTFPSLEPDSPAFPPDELIATGLAVQPIPIAAPYGEKKGRHSVRAFKVSPD